MASITSATMHKMKKPAAKKSAAVGGKSMILVKSSRSSNSNNPSKQRGWAPPLKPATYNSTKAKAIEDFRSKDTTARQDVIRDLFHTVLGETPTSAPQKLSTPHTASTTQDRSGAAADLAVLAKEVTGIRFLLKGCDIYPQMLKLLFPLGIEAVIKMPPPSSTNGAQQEESALPLGIKPSRSAISLTSMDDATTVTSMGDETSAAGQSDSKRGKTTPANAREGCFLLIRALCEIVGSPAVEPFVVGALLGAALDECASGNGAIHQAAQDTAMAIVNVANPWAVSSILRPLLLQILQTSTEWRIKAAALECFVHIARTKSKAVQPLIPKLLPPMVSQVWDTKPQVSKSARSALLAVCETNTNPDVKSTIPAVVNAVCKPSETNKAISELMGTTFVVPVDASTLAILCPVLARGLKEKLAIHKRAACLVISNMSKLVERPEAVAPFGSLLVPELQKVCENVQFHEIRDEALKALANLTKALGDSYKATEDESSKFQAKVMDAEQERVKAEQERVEKERQEALTKEEELKRKETEERQRFKEAMNAQRELEKLEAQKAAERLKAEEAKREKAKLSTKAAGGRCQACGLKKCKKTCVFHGIK